MSSDDGPPAEDSPASSTSRRGGSPPGGSGPLHRFRTAETGALALIRETLTSVGLVVLVAALLFGVSGVWPPMVAVESGSMNPHMYRGDLVFIVEEDRFAGPAAVEGTGVVTRQAAVDAGYRKFGGHGDVIVYRPDGRDRGESPIIHRAVLYVEDDENWYDRANGSHIQPRYEDCAELPNCPAPNAGFITRGDNPRTNQYYDQVVGRSRPVRPAWIEGKAMVRIPALGHIRLAWGELQRGTLFVVVAGAVVAGTRRRTAS